MTQLGANLLYAPFAAGMLVMYDTATQKHFPTTTEASTAAAAAGEGA